jgi:hypothetical protein
MFLEVCGCGGINYAVNVSGSARGSHMIGIPSHSEVKSSSQGQAGNIVSSSSYKSSSKPSI